MTQRVTVDIASISRIQFGCVGCTSCLGCCCASFEVCATEVEVARIVGMMPHVNRVLEAHGCEPLDGNVFEETDGKLLALDTDEDGLCVFAYSADGFIRCSLHSAALELGLPPEEVKPLVCTLWPLAIAGGRKKVLTADAEAPGFHCVELHLGRKSELCDAALETLEQVLGAEAVKAVAEAAEAGARRVTVKTSRVLE